MTSTQLTITRPDDWHIHLRDGAVLANTVADVARYFGRAICMPNLVPPVKTTRSIGILSTDYGGYALLLPILNR
jgi:dihydroorotase